MFADLENAIADRGHIGESLFVGSCRGIDFLFSNFRTNMFFYSFLPTETIVLPPGFDLIP